MVAATKFERGAVGPLSDTDAHDLIASILRSEEPAFPFVKALAQWAADKAELADQADEHFAESFERAACAAEARILAEREHELQAEALEPSEDELAAEDYEESASPYEVFGVRGLVEAY